MLERQSGRFANWLPVAAILGTAAYFARRHEPPLWAGAAVLAMAALAAVPRRWPTIHAIAMSTGFAAAGFTAAAIATARAPPFIALPSHQAALTGRIVSHDPLPEGARLLLDRVAIDGRPIGHRRIRLHAPDAPALQPGAWISVRARLDPPAPPAYPGGHDFQRDAWFSQLAGTGFTLQPPTILRAAPSGLIGTLRDRIARRVRAVLPGAPGAIAATLLTGLSAAIPAPDRTAFRDAGLAHLLAIAGLHIGIVMGLALSATRLILLRVEYIALRWPVRQLAASASLAAGLAYLVLTGVHIPTLRAFIMAGLVVAALLTGRRALSLRGWSIAVLVAIAVAPAEITGASFQLSFAAVLALIAGYQALQHRLRRLRGEGGTTRWLAHLAATLVLTSLLAGAASLPFIAYQFGRVQLYFVVANLLAVPATALFILPAGLLALALMPLGLDRVALLPMGWGIQAVLGLAHAVAAWPDATLAVPHMPVAALLAIALGLAWLCIWRGALRGLGAAAVLGGVLAAALSRRPDALVSADSRLIGVRAPTTLQVHAARGGDAYVQAAWEQYLGLPARPLDAAQCGPQGCLLHPHGATLRIATVLSSCDAAILITASGTLPFCPGALEIDRSTTWRNGAVALRAGPHPTMLTDRADRGDRPWVFLAPEQRRAGLDLPLAPTETPDPAADPESAQPAVQ